MTVNLILKMSDSEVNLTFILPNKHRQSQILASKSLKLVLRTWIEDKTIRTSALL